MLQNVVFIMIAMAIAYIEEWLLSDFLWNIWCATFIAALFYFPVIYLYLLPREQQIKRERSRQPPSCKKKSHSSSAMWALARAILYLFLLLLIYSLSLGYINFVIDIPTDINQQAENFFTTQGDECKADLFRSTTLRTSVNCGADQPPFILLKGLWLIMETTIIKVFFLSLSYYSLIPITIVQFGRTIKDLYRKEEIHTVHKNYWKAARNIFIYSLFIFFLYNNILGDSLLYLAIIVYYIPFKTQCAFVSFLGRILAYIGGDRGQKIK